MDLISIARKYKLIRRIIELIFLAIILIYIIIISNKCVQQYKISKFYNSCEKIYQKLNSSDEETIVAQSNDGDVVSSENIAMTVPVQDENWTENVKNIYKAEEKQVFLTFDDGPSKKVTIPILDILKQENVKATFFVLGSRVELNPEIVKREYEEGHYIANHGYSHTYSQIYSSPESVFDEYDKTESAIKIAIGKQEYSSMLFRFPGGSTGGKYNDIKEVAKQQLEEKNIAYLDWNALTGDAEGGKRTVEQLIQRLNETMLNRNSLVILMHDAGDKVSTYEALPQIISNLRQNGYVFKNFYEM